MKRLLVAATAFVLVTGLQPFAGSDPRHQPAMAQFMSAAFPLELVAAKKADRIAWIANDKGLRNVFTAAVNFIIQNPDGSSKLAGASYFYFFVGAMLVTAIIYVLVSPFYRGKTYTQDEAQG